MQNPFSDEVERCRIVSGLGDRLGDPFGAFYFRSRGLKVIASDGSRDIPWDHVSVSHRTGRAPTWAEMQWVKERFFRPDEAVIQIHPPDADYVDYSEIVGCQVLHLWRPHDHAIPMPPKVAI